MDYPYDDHLDADVVAFLTSFRAGPEEPDEKLAGLHRADMPVDLKAWLHTYSLHGGLISIGDVWFEAGNCMPLAHVTDGLDSEELEGLGRQGVERLDLEAAIVMGNTADGEVFYAAAWAPGDTALTMVKFCSSGYADDGYIALGSMMDTLRGIAANVEDPDDIDEEVRALLAPQAG